LGWVRKQLNGYTKAKDSFADALVRYSASREPEAEDGAVRVGAGMAEINALQSTEIETEEPELTDQ
jgi:hypothetical protein